MPGDCPASLHLLLLVCGKHSAPSRTPFRQATKTVRLPTGIGVHLQTGMLFGITTESCSASQRNRVHLRPDSPDKSPIFDIEHLQLFSEKTIRALLQRADFSDIRVMPVWNRYPIHYWMRLAPLPRNLKKGLVRLTKQGPLATVACSLPAGNIAAVTRKTQDT